MRLLKPSKLFKIGLIFIFLINLVSVFLIYFFSKNREKLQLKNCARFPVESKIVRDNEFWQELKLSSGFVKLFNAYLDERMNKTVVRVNVNGVELNSSRDVIYCQFWFEDKRQASVVRALNYTYLWGDGGSFKFQFESFKLG